jgi:hypothetical protein
MSEQQDLNESENLDAIYNTLRWNGVELAAQRLMEELQPQINAMLWRLETVNQNLALEAVIPDYETRNAYLESTGGDLKRVVSLAQWGIPPELAARHPEMGVLDLARLANGLYPEGDTSD